MVFSINRLRSSHIFYTPIGNIDAYYYKFRIVKSTHYEKAHTPREVTTLCIHGPGRPCVASTRPQTQGILQLSDGRIQAGNCIHSGHQGLIILVHWLSQGEGTCVISHGLHHHGRPSAETGGLRIELSTSGGSRFGKESAIEE